MYRVECPVAVHLKSSCMRSRIVTNLYYGLKLIEKSTETLIKMMEQINDSKNS